ncbi:MAG TPA: helix-turn-helix transcriptional regulator [Aquirhabdus sp.]
MSILEQLQKDLWGHNIAEIARVTGLSYPTVFNVANGKSPNVTFSTIQKIEKYLKDFDDARAN